MRQIVVSSSRNIKTKHTAHCGADSIWKKKEKDGEEEKKGRGEGKGEGIGKGRRDRVRGRGRGRRRGREGGRGAESVPTKGLNWRTEEEEAS